MAHVRKQVRDALASQLTGLTTTGARVHNGYVDPLQAANLPALSVTVADDASERLELGRPALTRRTITFQVRAIARASSAVEDVLDTICDEVETALGADLSLGGLVRDCELTATGIEVGADGDRIVGVATLQVQAIVNVREGAPSISL